MTDSQYPGELDTDVEIPRVDDNITEIGGEAINGLRSAVFNIEEALGLDPQGTTADVATRLDESLNPDGSLKASALSTIGLVTLPIDNAQIGMTAGIEESKLDLDYTTVFLRQLIASLDVFTQSINNRLIIDINHMTQHVASPSAYGRHETGDVDGYTGKYASSNLQGIIDDLDTRLISHITDTIDAHDASAISFVDTGTNIQATDVQEAIEQVDELQATLMVRHRDNMHSNAILKEQEAFLDGYKHAAAIVSSRAVAPVSMGDTSITFTGALIGALAQVSRGDRIEVTADGQLFVRYVESVVTASNIVRFFGSAPFGGAVATASVFRASEEIIAPSNLVLALKKQSGGSPQSIIQIVHPSSPYIMSSGIDIGQLSPTVRYIQLRWPDGYAQFDAYDALNTYTAAAPPSTWTPEVLAAALNDSFRPDAISSSLRGRPLLAFTYRGELGIAYDAPDGYLIEEAPYSGNSAWTALGFTGVEEAYSLGPRRFFIDGYEFSSIRTLVNASGGVEAGTPAVIENLTVDLDDLGLSTNGVVRVSGSSGDGTYIFNSRTSSTIRIDEYPFFAIDPSINVKIYADYFAADPTIRTLYELFVDGYNNSTAELRGVKRLEYENTSGAAPDGPEEWFDVVDVSRSFVASEKRLQYNNTTGTLTLGDRSGLTITNGGTAVTLPTSNEEGFRFKIYDGNGIDYLELEVVDGDYVSASNLNNIDVDVFDRVSEERYVQVGIVLHDTNNFKHLSDRRLFGNVGRRDVRDDYTRDYVTYPTSVLRGNGVIYGLDVSDSSGDIGVAGGQVLVNGILYFIGQTVITCPKNYAWTTYNLFVDDTGALRLLENDQNQSLASGKFFTPSIEEIMQSIDKTLLAQIVVDSVNAVDTIADYRKFVGDIDNKIDLVIADDPTQSRSFASLEAAAQYLNTIDSTVPSSRVLRVRGRIVLTEAITLPEGCILEGDNVGENSKGSRIELMSAGEINLSGDGILIRNLTFYSTFTKPNGMVGVLSGPTSYLFRMENCTFQFASLAANNVGFALDELENSIISGCFFRNVDTGILLGLATNCVVSENTFNGVRSAAMDITNATDCTLKDNYILSSTHSGSSTTGMIKLINPLRTIVRGNSIQTTSVSAASGNAIYISSSSLCVIDENSLVNTGSGVGFQKGIVVSYGQSDTFSKNMLTEFKGGSAEGLFLDSCYGSFLLGNQAQACRAPLVITDSNTIHVDNNIFSSDDDATVVSIGGINSYFITTTNNDISSFADPLTSDVVSVGNNGALPCGHFVGNTVYLASSAGTTTKALLYIDGPDLVVCNNIVTSPLSASCTVDSPITLSSNATDCIIENNNFRNLVLSGPSTIVDDGGTGNIERFNKGQTYYTVVPISRFVPHAGTSWTYNVAGTSEKMAVTGNVSGDFGVIEFSNIGVPYGSILETIEIYVVTNVSLTDLEAQWTAADWNVASAAGRNVSAVATPAASPGLITLTPTSTEYMNNTEIYCVRFEIKASNTVWIYGARITYIL